MVKPLGNLGNDDKGALSALRTRSRLQVRRLGANRVKGNLTLAPLRATSRPASLVISRSSGHSASDGKRRSTSLFDLPRSGRNLVGKLGAQTRTSNPLIAGLSGNRSSDSKRQGLLSFTRPSSSKALGLRLDSARSLISQQRSKSTRIDNLSRFLLASSNPRRPNAFGIKLFNSSLSIFG